VNYQQHQLEWLMLVVVVVVVAEVVAVDYWMHRLIVDDLV
jgi:uncharacterized oligopeptide transporter (OPT) family protein